MIEIGGDEIVVTHDTMVEGVHWLPGQDMADVAWKLVAVNLSDLAAKGAEPIGVLLGHMLGSDDARFVEGLGDVLTAYGVPLLGGDTVSGGPPRTLGLTALGRATSLPVPSRSGARAGEAVWMCGTVGAAMMGFEALRDGTGEDSQAYRRPRPLLAEGQRLAPMVNAMMDVSDGLLLDCARMCDASGVTIDLAPASVAIAAPEHRRADALRWGDDYALLFTISPGLQPPVPAVRIGEVVPRGDAALLLDGTPPADDTPLGYLHRA